MTETILEARAVSDTDDDAAAPVIDKATPPVLLPSPAYDRRRPMYVPVKNEQGKLLKVDKRLLYIDPEYQRRINERLVARIVANWSWISCGTLLVSQRPGLGTYFVIDGQHRWKAATYLSSVQEMPCLSFELDTVRDEALGFLASNTERRIPTLRDQFKALLVTGDTAAQTLFDLTDKYSRTIAAPSGPTTISCVSDCMRLLRESEATFKRIYPLASELCAGHPMTGRLLRGLHYLDQHMPSKHNLTAEYWRNRITHVGYEQIQINIKQMCMFENKGDNRTCAAGILRALNKGLQYPLEMRTDRGRRRA